MLRPLFIIMFVLYYYLGQMCKNPLIKISIILKYSLKNNIKYSTACKKPKHAQRPRNSKTSRHY